MRVKTRWKNKDKARTPEDVAGVLAFITWRIAANAVLNLENEGFQTDKHAQRLAIIEEFLAFLIHVVDRISYEQFTQEERQRFITALALKLADTMKQNMDDLLGRGDYREGFIDRLNERMSDYAEFSFTEEGPGFGFRRYLGERVTGIMGPKDSRWITDYIMDMEVPEALITLKRTVQELLPKAKEQKERELPAPS